MHIFEKNLNDESSEKLNYDKKSTSTYDQIKELLKSRDGSHSHERIKDEVRGTSNEESKPAFSSSYPYGKLG